METPGTIPRSGTRADRLCALAAAALGLLIYVPSIGYGFSNFDDPTYVADNPWIRALTASSFVRWWTADYFGNYAPLTLASYALDHALWGLRPAGYHLTNALLHAASCGLLCMALRRGALSSGAALAGAMVFAVHPAQVESVAWIAQRKTVLAGFLLVLSYLVYARSTAATVPSVRGLAAACAIYLAALLSKVSVVIFPGVLLLHDLGYRREVPLRRILAEKAPFALLAGAAAWAGYRAQVGFQVTTEGWLGGSPLLHVATMASLLARYTRGLLLPTGLSVLYDPPDARSAIDPVALAGYALAAIGAWGAWRAWRRDRRALPWMGFFWLGLLPVSQIIPYTVHMADRYLYIPMMGIAAGAGAGGAALLRRMRGPGTRAAAAVAVAAALACLAELTLARERVWRDPLSLWSDAIRRPPVHWVSWYNHAKVMDGQGRLPEAIASYERALAVNPESVLASTNVGRDYAAVGELDLAESSLRRAMALPRAVPEDRARAASLLGELLLARGRPAGAIAPLQRAIAWQPRSVSARLLLARSLRALDRPAEARMRLDQALDLDPRSAEAWLDRGLLSAAEGRPEAARPDLDHALALAPPGPLRARILDALGSLPGAGKAPKPR